MSTIPPAALTALAYKKNRLGKRLHTPKYLLPPYTSLSRYTYQTQTLSNTPIPASAAILWPYSPKTDRKFLVVAWAHGTSGIFAQNAPSNHRALWQHFSTEYQLVGAGYVVVMPVYAGLGVSKTEKGEGI
ncbi:MAG: hypothetical protein LQ337_008166, partial [Flavoplaca oasis]